MTEKKISFPGRIRRWRWDHSRRIRRQAGIRNWTRPLGSSGLPPEAEAWVRQIEDDLRSTELRLRG